ncbi:DMT family transporter [Paenisporosarcina cavernae]|uniref:QacE family quaternary ammonium compound efflux SMR transporter n=1 Tax=Paenisporosarcina cavernae TaxID=2320858 RepID=A0A385YS48_9BACL|nr:multidrug efflux SMR transporter [Paenisporosarcina cavernae]AYC28542.1 QacE family quaternary ammonium compound efflux SMR transporter [Paenisporosarcina cavernae]
MAWFWLLLAGLFETSGVVTISLWHRKKSIYRFISMLVAFTASFLFLALAMKELTMGLAYAIWTGIGATGGAVVGMLYFEESRDWKRLVAISIIVASVIGLKLLS